MNPTHLERCRAVKYASGAAGRKGSRKCAECGFFFVPDDTKYPFHDDDAGEVCRTGKEWFAETGCCPNCDPLGEAHLGWRRCLGRRNRGGGWNAGRGCGEWFRVESGYDRINERAKRYRRQICPDCQFVPQSRVKEKMLANGRRLVLELGRAPTTKEFGVADSRTAQRVFDSWNNFIIALGEEPRKPGQNIMGNIYRASRLAGLAKYNAARLVSKEECLAALRNAGNEYGHALSRKEWNSAGLKPCSWTIEERFGSWNKAWIAAGLEPNQQGIGANWIVKRYTDPGRPAYEILNDPNSHYNQQRREVERKTEYYIEEMNEAAQRWEDGKFGGAQ